MIVEVTDANFEEEVLNSDKLVVVDFWAPWCGPCKMMTPVIEAIAEKMGDKIKVAKLNTDNSPDSAVKHRIMGIPSLIMFKDGAEAERLVGFQKQEALEQAINANL